jgi:hypothetical protein
MAPTLDELLREQNALRVMLGKPGKPVFLDVKPGRLTDHERKMIAGRLSIVTEEIQSLLSEKTEFDQF